METFNAQAALLMAEVQGIFLDRLEAWPRATDRRLNL
jgi:hypothetical protein